MKEPLCSLTYRAFNIERGGGLVKGERMMYSGKKLDHRAGDGAARSPFDVCLEAADRNAPRFRVTPIITPFQQ